MATALTALQLEVLRRVRDGNSWSREAPVEGELREALLLCGLGLIDHTGFPGGIRLTAFGRAYLEAAEAAASAERPDRPDRPPPGVARA